MEYDVLEVIRHDLSEILDHYMLELNTEETRDQIRHDVSSYLNDLVRDLSVTNYKIFCDRYNNPPIVVDSNNLVVDVYIKPAFNPNFYQCRALIERTGKSVAKFEDYDRAMRVIED